MRVKLRNGKILEAEPFAGNAVDLLIKGGVTARKYEVAAQERRKVDNFEFEDIDIMSSIDLEVTIAHDADVWVYTREDGRKYLDFSPQTLGYEILD